MNVAMIGAGYVGLVSGACLAEFGAAVTCIDTDAGKIDKLRRGIVPFYEPGLPELIHRNSEQGRLSFQNDYESVIEDSDLVFIAVGTPALDEEGSVDLSCVRQAVRDFAPRLKGYTLVVDKSTVPVGTAQCIKRIIEEENPNADFDVASNPEFLREGSAVEDFMRPDRVVIGVENERSENLLRELYRPLDLTETPVLVTTPASAELTKYAANAFLATKISFINEISALCEAVNADISDVAAGMGLDHRIGKRFLHPGPGYGGSCFPKDTRALARIARDHGVDNRITAATVAANEAQKARMTAKIRQLLGGDENGKIIAVLGLAYKPETDDMRDAPALSILPQLIAGGAEIRAHDPQAMAQAKTALPDSVRLFDEVYAVFPGADAAVLMTEWNSYRNMNLDRIRKSMRGNLFIDLRNVYDPDLMREAGFDYAGVGR